MRGERSASNPPPGAHAVIAIDGGAGTGKTTSAARVAARLGFSYVDSGAVYRAIAFALREQGIADPESRAVEAALAALPLRIDPIGSRFRVWLGEREVSSELRSPEVTRLSSRLAVRPDIRRRVSDLLREAARLGPLVVEGRDIGTVVFPDAPLKVFLVAPLAVRADRRRLDLRAQGIDQSREEVERDLAERDHRDSTRDDSPLRQAETAIEIDTGTTDIDGQVAAILAAWAEVRRSAPPGSDPGAPGVSDRPTPDCGA